MEAGKDDSAVNRRKELNRNLNLSVVGLAVIVAIILVVYFLRFPITKGLSSDPAAWGQFGDYVGGILNPLIAFGAFFWLTRSVAIQRQELEDTRKEMRQGTEAQSRLAEYQRATIVLNALTSILRGVEFQIESADRAISLVENNVLTSPNPLVFRGEKYSHPNGKYDLIKVLQSRLVDLEEKAERYRNLVLENKLVMELGMHVGAGVP